MAMQTPQQRTFPAVAVVTVVIFLCIFPGQHWINQFFPQLPGLVKIRPSLIVLDIPNDLPVSIDLVLVSALFVVIYPLVVLVYPFRSREPSWAEAMQRLKSAFAGFFVLLASMVAGGALYYFAADSMPRNIRNGIGSFGLNADIFLPYPGFEKIHLGGSMFVFAFFIVGLGICIRQIRKDPGARRVGRLTREQRMTPYQRMLAEKSVQERALKQAAQNRGYESRPLQTGTRDIKRSGQMNLCFRQPVSSFKPEAARYMPVSSQ